MVCYSTLAIIIWVLCGHKGMDMVNNNTRTTRVRALLEEKVLYRTLKGSISVTYLEPLKGSIHC